MTTERGKTKIDISPEGPKTSREFVQSLKDSVVSSHVYEGGVEKRKVHIKNEDTVKEFVRLYKPFVFGILKRKFYFKLTEDRLISSSFHLDAEEVFNQVILKFFKNSKLKSLDFSKRSGKSPFRSYLTAVVASVFYEMTGGDLVDEYGPDGKPVLVEMKDAKGRAVFETDGKGNVKMDDAGHPVVKMKPRKIRRFVAESAVYKGAWGDYVPALWMQRKPNVAMQNLLLDIVTLAYISVIESKKPDSWIYEAMAAIFEKGEEDRDVAVRLMEERKVKSQTAFFAGKSRFCKDWHDKWMELYGTLCKSNKGREFQDDILKSLWEAACKRLSKRKNVNELRRNIAEWAHVYSQRATTKKGRKCGRHRF